MVAMTPEAVRARLVEMSARSASEPSPMPHGVDMSPRAVAARLREMNELCELCHRLAEARPT